MGILTRLLIQSQWKKNKKADDARIATLTPTAGIAEDTNIPYIEDGHQLHLVDVYYPEGTTGLLPTVVDIHGGGWMYGDKELNKYYCLYLASQGFAVVNMSYRLLPEVDLRGQAQDIFACLHWLEANAKQHHCDLGRVLVTGDSAGGHLTGLTACIQADGELQTLYGVKPVSFTISAIAINHGVCDPTTGITGRGFADREINRMLAGKEPDRLRLLSKVNFQDTAPGLKLPPVLLVSSEADVLHSHSVALAKWLTDRGIPYRTKFWTREQGAELGHVFNVLYPNRPESIETNKAILSFFTAASGAL
jgi:acetyl esterase/lipase